MDASGEVGAVNGNGKSRRTGKRSGYESHHARRVDVEAHFSPVAVRAAEQIM